MQLSEAVLTSPAIAVRVTPVPQVDLEVSGAPGGVGEGVGGVTDGDKGDIIVSVGGEVWEVDPSFYREGSTDVALADGGTGASLTDPNADRILFWDDSAGAMTWLALGTNLSITGTTLDATGGGGAAVSDAAFGAGWNGDATNAPSRNAVYDELLLRVATATLGSANGTATLGADGKLASAQIPDALVGAVRYQGTWNASTNTPAIPAAASGNKGYYYKVATAGSTSISGITDWQVGDWLISNGASWDKIDNTDSVTSVAGLVGVITAAALKTALALVKADVGLGNVDNTSDANKPISTATQTALDLKADARPTILAKNASYTAADAENNAHIVYSGAGTPVLTLNAVPAAGTSFTGRFTTAWAVTCASLSKNGAAAVANGTIAAGKLVTFLHEGGGVWVAGGDIA